MFFLKHYNRTLLQFEITDDNLDGQRIECLKGSDNLDTTMLPIGVRVDPDILMKWLRGRIIPKNREFVDSFLAKMA